METDILEIVLSKGCKSLNLSNSNIIGYFLSLIQNSKLRELDLSNCKATAAEVFEDLLSTCHSLIKLSLEGLLITQKMAKSICQNNKTLQEVNLNNSNFELVSRELDKLCLRNKLTPKWWPVPPEAKN